MSNLRIYFFKDKKINVKIMLVNIFKFAAPNLSDILCSIINESFKFGVLPQQSKCATIIPIFKGGDKEMMSIYRSNSIPPFLSKLFENL